jgi:TatD DNase family protein
VQFVDTHSHLFSEEFNHDRGLVIERAKKAGVKYIVLPNIDTASIPALLNTSQENPNFCFPTLGLHPTSVKNNFEEELNTIENLLNEQKFCGIGEIGIDLYWDKTHIDEQKRAFRYQLKLAKKLNLPVIIHSRNSFDEILEIVDQEIDSSLKGVFHSFSGNINHYKHIEDYKSFYVGIGGVVTYKNGEVDKLLNQMDLNRVLLETDSPYLTPVPYRGKRNESAYLILIASKIADIISLPIEQVAQITTHNANALFDFEKF